MRQTAMSPQRRTDQWGSRGGLEIAGNDEKSCLKYGLSKDEPVYDGKLEKCGGCVSTERQQ
jgi:hypothetical protein